jgi:hypothetical protein
VRSPSLTRLLFDQTEDIGFSNAEILAGKWRRCSYMVLLDVKHWYTFMYGTVLKEVTLGPISQRLVHWLSTWYSQRLQSARLLLMHTRMVPVVLLWLCPLWSMDLIGNVLWMCWRELQTKYLTWTHHCALLFHQFGAIVGELTIEHTTELQGHHECWLDSQKKVQPVIQISCQAVSNSTQNWQSKRKAEVSLGSWLKNS